jgi:hypothetical protein
LGLIATREGLNRLINTMGTPEYGTHMYSPLLGEYVPVDACPDGAGQVAIPLRGDATTDPDDVMSMPSCVEVPRGVGRSQFSRYDSSGYDVFRRILESGHFYDQMAALVALQTSNASVVGIGQDVNADARTFRIPYNLLFPEEVEGLMSSIYNEDDHSYALHVQDVNGVGTVMPRTVFEPMAPEQVERLPVLVPGRTYTTRVQALVAGMNMLDGSLNAAFAKRGQISLLGSGEQRTPPDGFEIVQADNPQSGRSFIAYRATDGSPGWYAADLLEKAQRIAKDPNSSDADIENIFGDIELVRLAFGILGD